jgi:hypothetical protein
MAAQCDRETLFVLIMKCEQLPRTTAQGLLIFCHRFARLKETEKADYSI